MTATLPVRRPCADVEDTCVRLNWMLKLAHERAPDTVLVVFLEAYAVNGHGGVLSLVSDVILPEATHHKCVAPRRPAHTWHA